MQVVASIVLDRSRAPNHETLLMIAPRRSSASKHSYQHCWRGESTNLAALHPQRFDEAKRQHYAALYALPGAIRAGFAQFAAFGQDALDSKAYLAKGKLTMPVLAIGGEAAFGSMMATVMRAAANYVQEAIVPDSGHWIMEENPSADYATCH